MIAADQKLQLITIMMSTFTSELRAEIVNVTVIKKRKKRSENSLRKRKLHPEQGASQEALSVHQ